MHNIGDVVFVAEVNAIERHISCPDCFGKKFLRVTLGDDSQVSVDCPTCEGSDGWSRRSLGTVTVTDYVPQVVVRKVKGIDQQSDGSFHYNLEGAYGKSEMDLSTSAEEAQPRADMLTQNQIEMAALRAAAKEKPNKTWAWHVGYHRGCVRRAEKDLAYHKSKLEVALTHQQQEKAARPTVPDSEIPF